MGNTPLSWHYTWVPVKAKSMPISGIASLAILAPFHSSLISKKFLLLSASPVTYQSPDPKQPQPPRPEVQICGMTSLSYALAV